MCIVLTFSLHLALPCPALPCPTLLCPAFPCPPLPSPPLSVYDEDGELVGTYTAAEFDKLKRGQNK